MKVTIKERKLTAGNRSLYLEYYETGFRRKENLGLYLIPDDAPNAKKINAAVYEKARGIQAARILNPPSLDKIPEVRISERAGMLTWLEWCDEYMEWSRSCGNCRKMMQHKGVVRKRIESYLTNRGRKKVLLKDVGRKEISGLFDYMRDEYRNPGADKIQRRQTGGLYPAALRGDGESHVQQGCAREPDSLQSSPQPYKGRTFPCAGQAQGVPHPGRTDTVYQREVCDRKRENRTTGIRAVGHDRVAAR